MTSATVETTPAVEQMRAFRQCAGAFATGVCVISSEHDGNRAGMTVNSFTSVSLDPFSILVSLNADSRTLSVIRSSGSYSLSVLGIDQHGIALQFARQGDPYPSEHVDRKDSGLEVRAAVAHMHCDVQGQVPVKDHVLVIGRVVDFSSPGGHPLVFHAGRFGGLNPDRSPLLTGGLLGCFGW